MKKYIAIVQVKRNSDILADRAVLRFDAPSSRATLNQIYAVGLNAFPTATDFKCLKVTPAKQLRRAEIGELILGQQAIAFDQHGKRYVGTVEVIEAPIRNDLVGITQQFVRLKLDPKTNEGSVNFDGWISFNRNTGELSAEIFVAG